MIEKINTLSDNGKMVKLYTELSRREIEFNNFKEEAQEAGFKEDFNDDIKQNNLEIPKKC